MTEDTAIQINVLSSLTQIKADDWDGCACPETANGQRPNDPFTTHSFLRGLEVSGSVGTGTGWTPQYLQATLDGETIGVAPMYVKSHSQGEYIFDHNIAHAYEGAGGRYYPKLQIAVPFTPATGRRFLTRAPYEELAFKALVQGAVQITANNNLSSLHATFCTKAEVEAGSELGLMPRVSQQFHWRNQSYPNFEAFLASLSSRKRKNIRKERETAAGFGGTIHALTGDDIQPEHWGAFWQFYQDTGARKWGTPYLTRGFFDYAQDHLRKDILLVLAERDGVFVAGALNFIGRNALYGRYWGCVEDHPCLHFELCYYQAIDFAIANGLDTVEAGAQGSHKLARGYMPVITHSLHWFPDPNFAEAVGTYLEAEADAVAEDIEIMTAYGPFRNERQEEQE